MIIVTLGTNFTDHASPATLDITWRTELVPFLNPIMLSRSMLGARFGAMEFVRSAAAIGSSTPTECASQFLIYARPITHQMVNARAAMLDTT